MDKYTCIAECDTLSKRQEQLQNNTYYIIYNNNIRYYVFSLLTTKFSNIV